MARTAEKWFAMRTDFFGMDAYQLGMLQLSPRAIGLYVASVAYVCKFGRDEVHRNYARMAGVERPGPVIRELVEHGFWVPLEPGRFGVAHEGTLWRRGDGVARRAVPLRTRAAVMERDGFACVECGQDRNLSVDHIWPYSRGGTDDLDNLRVLCRPCNSRKGARVDGA